MYREELGMGGEARCLEDPGEEAMEPWGMGGDCLDGCGAGEEAEGVRLEEEGGRAEAGGAPVEENAWEPSGGVWFVKSGFVLQLSLNFSSLSPWHTEEERRGRGVG